MEKTALNHNLLDLSEQERKSAGVEAFSSP